MDGGYENENDAINALKKFHKTYKYNCDELILMKKFCRS